jgi:hypothetical protein
MSKHSPRIPSSSILVHAKSSAAPFFFSMFSSLPRKIVPFRAVPSSLHPQLVAALGNNCPVRIGRANVRSRRRQPIRLTDLKWSQPGNSIATKLVHIAVCFYCFVLCLVRKLWWDFRWPALAVGSQFFSLAPWVERLQAALGCFCGALRALCSWWCLVCVRGIVGGRTETSCR